MTFEEELLSSLDSLIKTGDVIVGSSSDKYFAQLGSMFPIFGSKIDWGKIPEAIEEIAKKGKYVESCSNFFIRMCKKYGLSGNVILVGDSALEIALIMPIDVLKTYLKQVLEIPQHHYIFAEDYSWCMSFTMEGDMAFGFKPNSIK